MKAATVRIQEGLSRLRRSVRLASAVLRIFFMPAPS